MKILKRNKNGFTLIELLFTLILLIAVAGGLVAAGIIKLS